MYWRRLCASMPASQVNNTKYIINETDLGDRHHSKLMQPSQDQYIATTHLPKCWLTADPCSGLLYNRQGSDWLIPPRCSEKPSSDRCIQRQLDDICCKTIINIALSVNVNKNEVYILLERQKLQLANVGNGQLCVARCKKASAVAFA